MVYKFLILFHILIDTRKEQVLEYNEYAKYILKSPKINKITN